MSPNGTVGTSHLGMYSSYGTMSCATCHDGVDLPKAPVLAVRDADMRRGVSCSSCHSAGDRDRGRADALFISSMNDRSKIVYSRCSSCHTIASDGDGGGGWGGGGWGGGSGGGYGGGGGGR
jgi:hypothetical protein